MSKRSKEIIRTIQKAGKKAGDPTLDLDRKQVADLHQNTKKTYKQFVESNTKESQFKLEVQKEVKKKKKEDELADRNSKARDEFRHGKGMVAYKKGVKGRIGKDGVFVPD